MQPAIEKDGAEEIGEQRGQPPAAAIGEPAEADHAERREEARHGEGARGIGAVEATLQQVDHHLRHQRKCSGERIL